MRWTRRVRRPPRTARTTAPIAEQTGTDAWQTSTQETAPAAAPPASAGPEVVGAGVTLPRRRGPFWRFSAVALAGAVIGGGIVYLGVPLYRVAAAGFAQIQTQPVTATQESAGAPAVTVFREISPSVVLVQSNSTANSGFGSTQTQTDFGSGVIFNADGYIVTNDHVVNGASSITVTLADGKTYKATLVGADSSTDLAVLRINATGLPAATFANSNDVVPGEIAVAVGNPLGPQYAQTVTSGIVGAIRPMLYGLSSSTQRITQMIQTDAPINPGNSGGALANAQGEVIGITTLKVAQTGEAGVAATGLGFAIPSNMVQRVVNDIVQYGYVKWAWLGIDIYQQPTSGVSAASTPVTAPETLTIQTVQSGGPSAGKLQAGDIITSFNGQKVLNYYDLVGAIDLAHPGQTVSLGILRHGTPITVQITLGTEPASDTTSTAAPVQPVPSASSSTSPFSPFGPFPFG